MSEQQKKRRRKRSKKAQLKKKRRVMLVCISIVGVILLAFGIAFFVAKGKVDQVAKDTVWNNISIDEMDVSGMKETEVKAMLEQKQTEYGASSIVLKAEEASAEVLLPIGIHCCPLQVPSAACTPPKSISATCLKNAPI